MPVKIDKEIREAIRELIRSYGSAVEVERRTKITNSNISKYLSGKVTKMNDASWQVLEPHLRPYLSEKKIMEIRTGDHSPVYGNTITHNGDLNISSLSEVEQKILNADELSDAEKVKVLRILKK